MISLSDRPEDTWIAAGWVFRQLLRDVAKRFPADAVLIEELRVAETESGLHLDKMSAALSRSASLSIQEVATGILAGTVPSSVREFRPDDETESLYRDGLKTLVSILSRAGHRLRA